jgi:Transcriptional Coactivator p15 (PC4)
MKKARAQGTFGTVIKELKPLREGDTSDVRASIVERDSEHRLDIRYFVKTEKYTGPTKKGISLSADEYDALRSQDKKIRRLLRS